MTKESFLALGTTTLVEGCGPRDELPQEAIEAYQSNNRLRQAVLEKCAGHITAQVAFATEADIDEWRKAVTADGNVRLIQHQAREQAESSAILSATVRQFEE